MPTDESDPNLRFLAAFAAFAYAVAAMLGVIVLLGLPTVRALAAESSTWYWGMPVEVRLTDAPRPVTTEWGPAEIRVDDVRADLRLPIPRLPWSMVAALWVYALVGFGLMLGFLRTLRDMLRTARDGAPFDPANARRLKQLGLLLVAIVALNGAAEMATAAVVRASVASTDIVVPVRLHFSGWALWAAFVLLALARVFQRGADLEHEQSLVV